MGSFSLHDLGDWCAGCDADTIFCEAIENDTTPANGTDTTCAVPGAGQMSPAVVGVVGAVVFLAMLLLSALVAGLCGFRVSFHRRRKAGTEAGAIGGIGALKSSGSGNGGGFKGAEKLASDTDLTLEGGPGASVVKHERVGSWELNDKKNGALDKDVESGRMERVVSRADYGRRSEEIVDPFGDPVKPLDQV